jgi:hypothetical protein
VNLPGGATTKLPRTVSPDFMAGTMLIGMAALALAGCASSRAAHKEEAPAVTYRADTEGLMRPVRSGCSAAPSSPEEARANRLSALVELHYVVRRDGTVGEIASSTEVHPLFLEAAKAWLRACHFEAGRLDGEAVDVSTNETVVFRNPPEAQAPQQEAEGEPVEFTTTIPHGFRPPAVTHCSPAEAPWQGRYPAVIDFVVHTDGHASDIELAPGPVELAAERTKTVQKWLEVCPFKPATLDGKPIAVRAHISNDFPPDYPRGQALEAVREVEHVPPVRGPYSRPVPKCKQERPSRPDPKQFGLMTGMVLVKYVVGTDGRVRNVQLLNPGVGWDLFVSVRDWILGCTFVPSRNADGALIAAQVVQPFNFKVQ